MRTMASVCMAVAVLCAGCASTGQRAETPPPQDPNTRVVKAKDGSATGEIVGRPARNSKFGRLQIGMTMTQAQAVLGHAPDQWHTYESGKRWIPYYFGDDARRMQAFYKGEGCLTFTAGHVWGSGGGDLIRIENDATGACYQP